MYQQLDRIDRNILVELQKDGRLSNVELARRIGLSATPCLERVKKLEREGYIKGYKAVVDPTKLGQGLLVYVEVTVNKNSPDVFDCLHLFLYSIWYPIMLDFGANLASSCLPTWKQNPAKIDPRAIQDASNIASCF